MPRLLTQINEANLHRVDFLNEQLLEHQLLVSSSDLGPLVEFVSQDSPKVVSDDQQARFVIVGQAINLLTINAIKQEFFGEVPSLSVRPHTLHQQFGRQAFVIEASAEFANWVTSHHLLQISHRFFVDCFPISSVSIKEKGLLVMDMDSTIIDMECIDEIAFIAGAGEKVANLTERAMQGELDFNESLQARVGCLSGLELSVLEGLRSRLPINPGFAATIAFLQSNGWQVCIASGGFTYFADYLKNTFNLDAAVSNTLGIKDNKLTGTVIGDIVNADMKAQVLLEIADKEGIQHGQTIAIGDGANDLVMMDKAQLGIAYKAKEKVKMAADANILYCGFEGLLYTLKYS